ncbi:MAG: hypothetical protein QOF36_1423 [Microbacteriaceae bacterium]|nr:hypothetical protein [Microbacteriaceae bacterium]
MSELFDPISIRGLTIRNRIWVAPMCQYTVLERDGVPRDWHFVHLGAMAAGGSGLIVAEASGVSPEGRISPTDTGLWNDIQRDAWARIVGFIHSQGTKVGIQLAHAGRKASTWPDWGVEGRTGSMTVDQGGWDTVSASDLPYPRLKPPRRLDIAGIDEVIGQFVAAARRAVEAGFDVLELHAAHGYLIHQFLSPLSNDRTDDYGGSLENRARFLLRTVRAVRAAIGDSVPLFVRFSATDYVDGAWSEGECAAVAGWALEAGADFFDISSGGIISGVPIPVAPGYQVPLAENLKRVAAVSVSAVGLITSAQQAAEIVTSGQADAVMLGREISRDPHFALRAAHELGVEIDYWPPQYIRTHWPKADHVETAFNDD